MSFSRASRRSALWTTVLSLGVVLALSPPAAHANLLFNGDFEAGVLAPWTVSGGTVIDTSFVQDGSFAASLGSVPPDPATLAQDVATTPGTSYTLSFYVLDQAIDALNTLTVSFGAFATVISGADAFDPGGTNGFALESFIIDAADIVGTTTALLFSAVNDVAAFSIDGVVLTSNGTEPPPPPPSVPEPGAALLLLPMLAMLGVARRGRGAAAQRV